MLIANESESFTPGNHSTNPSGIDLLAEPEPLRARQDNSLSDKFSPIAVLAERLNAAKAEAEEAIPVPMGKLLSRCMINLKLSTKLKRHGDDNEMVTSR